MTRLVKRSLDKIPSFWFENKKGERFKTKDFELPPRCFEHYVQRTRFIELRDTGYTRDGNKLCEWHGSFSTDLFLSLARPSLKQRIISLYRNLKWLPAVESQQALLMCAVSCERCMNTMAWERGLSWGYKKNSEEYARSRTSCELCLPVEYYLIEE